MRTVALPVAYIPLVDAAPLIVAQEMGFAEAEGLSLDLIAGSSWSSVRDMLAFGRVDAAHMLSPVPVAMALGLGGVTTSTAAIMVLSMNGNTFCLGRRLETRLRAAGYGFDFTDARAAAEALAGVIEGGLTIGVPFPFSMQVELLRYWIAATPLAGSAIEIRTVPPPLMAQALADGDIDAFCVGEPWGSVAVDQGNGALLLPGRAIWAAAPEKVLAVRSDWAETEPHLTDRLLRAVWRAGKWLGAPGNATTAASILSRKAYLDLPAELIDRALTGALVISGQGEQRRVPQFVEFHAGAATFPWRSQARWIARQMAARVGLDPAQAMDRAGSVFRGDIYRRALAPVGADIPSRTEKREGAIGSATEVDSSSGRVVLTPDPFFDRMVFDPAAS